MQGAFHLVDYDGTWKIEEMYLIVPQEGATDPLFVAMSVVAPYLNAAAPAAAT